MVEWATSRTMSAYSWLAIRDRVVGVDVLGEAVDDRLVLALERAEQAVPDDEDAAVVAVEVLAVAAVVHPVVRRRVEHLLAGAERADRVGVDPVLVEQVDARGPARSAPAGCRRRAISP